MIERALSVGWEIIEALAVGAWAVVVLLAVLGRRARRKRGSRWPSG